MSAMTGERAVGAETRARMPYRDSTETKHSSKTTELYAMIAAVAGVLIASWVSDGFDARQAWTLVSAIAIGYMISRGLAKSGSREPYWSRGDDRV
jgi:hypothetical protein